LFGQRKIVIIALSLLIGLSAALYTKFIKLPTYTASYQLFFQEESGGLSGAMRLASSFGLGGSVADQHLPAQRCKSLPYFTQ
jgi:hypothetical protein